MRYAKVGLIAGIALSLGGVTFQLQENLGTLRTLTRQTHQRMIHLQTEKQKLTTQEDVPPLEKVFPFKTADRLKAGALIKKISQRHGLKKLTFSFKPEEPFKEDLNLIKTHVQLTFSALNDADVLTFIKTLESEFPGVLNAQSLVLYRPQEEFSSDWVFKENILNNGLIHGEYGFEWIIPPF